VQAALRIKRIKVCRFHVIVNLAASITRAILQLWIYNCSVPQPAAISTVQSPDFDANNSYTTSGIGAGNNPARRLDRKSSIGTRAI